MSASPESHFASEYGRALADHLKQAGGVDDHRVRELDALARSLHIPLHEIVANHSDSLSACLPGGPQPCDYSAATDFLRALCQAAESGDMSEREQFLRKLAHAIRTPLTTLRLSLQVAVGQLEKGEPVSTAMLQKSIAQVDKLTAQIGELFKNPDSKARPSAQPGP